MSQIKCFHCHKNSISHNSLCNNCRFDKNIMMTATEIKKNYKISEDDIDSNKIYNETFKTIYGSYGKSYYIPELHQYVKNILVKDKISPKYLIWKKIEEMIDKIESEKENTNKVFKYVMDGIIISLNKYNIPKNFIEDETMNEIIKNKINNLIENYNHNIDKFVINILEIIEKFYNKKLEIDGKIDEFIDPEFEEEAIKLKCYNDFIYKNKNLDECIDYMLREQEKILFKDEREEKIKKFMMNYEKEIGHSLKQYLKYIDKYKNQYVNDNLIKYETCVKKIKKIVNK